MKLRQFELLEEEWVIAKQLSEVLKASKLCLLYTEITPQIFFRFSRM
jgi:hypothetical protein